MSVNFSFFKIVLRGIGQIMLQENAATGLVFLTGIFIGSIPMGAAALLAAVIGTFTAMAFRFGSKEIEQGMYGFSPALVGVATFVFLKPVLLSWIILVAGSVLAAALQHFFIRKAVPVFTLPFVLVTWCIFYGAAFLSPDLLKESAPLALADADRFFFPLKGYGQVIFQAGLWSGLLFLAGVCISSPVAAGYGLLGAVISGILAYRFVSYEEFAGGLLSYNAVLCAIVFAGKEIKNLYTAMIAVVLSLAISLLMRALPLPALTFPFVLASYLTLLVKSRLR